MAVVKRMPLRLDSKYMCFKILVVLGLFGLFVLPVSAQEPGREEMEAVLQALQRQAESGDTEAQFQLGLRMVTSAEQGKHKIGAAWIQKAANADHEKAMHVLGSLYEEGQGVTKSIPDAIKWHEKAADKGMAESMLSLAMIYDQGQGVEKDDSQAAEWAMRSAEAGHPPGQALYAFKMLRGSGTPKSPARAAVWFLKAAQQGNGFSQRQLANLYFTGNGVPVDYARCEAWYRRAAKNPDDPWALNDLAWFLCTCPEEKYHDSEESIAIAKAAIKTLEALQGQQRHEMIDTMAAALARAGKYTEALLWQRRCVALLKEDKELEDEERQKLEAEFNGRVKLYTEKKAYADKPAQPEKPGEPLPNDRILEDQKLDDSRKPKTERPTKSKEKKSVV
jgi:TPR repeat protein